MFRIFGLMPKRKCKPSFSRWGTTDATRHYRKPSTKWPSVVVAWGRPAPSLSRMIRRAFRPWLKVLALNNKKCCCNCTCTCTCTTFRALYNYPLAFFETSNVSTVLQQPSSVTILKKNSLYNYKSVEMFVVSKRLATQSFSNVSTIIVIV